MVVINKIKIFLMAVGVLALTNAVHGKIPKRLLSVDKVIDEIKMPLNNKLLQMHQNFIEETAPNIIKYTSDKISKCQLGQSVPVGENILKITKQRSKNTKLKKHITTYTGCSGQESFKEISIKYTSGNDSYEFIGPDNTSIFKTIRLKDQNQTTSQIFMNDQMVFKIIERKRNGYDEVLYKKYPFTVSLNYNGGKINFNSVQSFNGAYRLKIYPGRRVEYFDDSSQLISLANFQKQIGFRGINYFIDLALKDLPKTKFINSGNGNTKLLEELRNAQTFLISGSNIDYVKNLINEYIKEAVEGNIIDNRR
jgi:hypothetical protein